MTVNELLNECEKLKKDGFGEREIWISNDDEGNGYHMLFYTFMTDEEDIRTCLEWASFCDKEPEEVVILG